MTRVEPVPEEVDAPAEEAPRRRRDLGGRIQALTLGAPWRMPLTTDEGTLWLLWLVRLRWVAIIGQVVTLSFTLGVLDHPVVVVPALLGSVAVLVAANGWAIRRLEAESPVPETTLLAQLLLDVAVLTGFFVAAGGPANPFVMLYLIHIAMAAVMMPSHYALLVMATVVVANGVLHAVHLPLHLDRHVLPPNVMQSLGQVTAFSVTVASIGFFVLGMADTLRRQRQRLLDLRDRAAKTDRLRAVGTLAAGAAHELNTPLSTMDLRLRRVKRRHGDEATHQDLDVVSTQLERCVRVVEQLLVGAGDPSAAGFDRAPLQELTDDGVRLWSRGTEQPVETQLADDPIVVTVPRVAFTQALINLLENAREAQAEADVTTPLLVRVRREGTVGLVEVIDHGPGLPQEPDRVGEPFFTTKSHGTGLGVFVARSVAEGAGGGLDYRRTQHRTIARWWFPETRRTT